MQSDGAIAEEDKWRNLVAIWPGFVLTIDAKNRITSLSLDNDRFDASRHIARDLFEVVPEDAESYLSVDLAAVRAGQSVVRRARIRLIDGRFRWFETRYTALQADGVLIVGLDVTDEETAKLALRLLAEASREFSEATDDYDRLLRVITRCLAEGIGDLCTIRPLSEDGATLDPGNAHHPDPEIASWAHQLLTDHRQSVNEGLMGRVAISGEPLFVPKIELDEYIQTASQPYRALLDRLRIGSIIVVPMLCRGKVVGVVSLLRSGSENPYTQQDLQLVQNLGDHAALAITNARSFAAARVARAAAVSANETLQKSEVAHRLLFDASPIPLFVFDVETLDLLAANAAAVRLYGYSHDELLRMKVSDLRIDAERESVPPPEAGAGEADDVGTVRQRRKDGSTFFAEYTSRPLSFAGRRARFTVVSDVTGRRDAEEMRSLLAAIVESSNDAVVSKRLDGVITSWNHAAESLFGYTAAEAVGQPIDLIIPAERLVEERELFARATGGGRIEQFETIRRRKDGRLVSVALSLSPIFNASGRVIGVSKVARDLSAQLQAEETLRSTEEQLRQAQKLEAVGRLAGGIAHDFNNVLSVILSYSDLILAELKPPDPLVADIGEVRKAALRAAELTRQLLVFSRQQVIAPKVLDLNEVVASVDRMIARIVGEDIEIVSVAGENLGRVLADRNNVEQVIMNLVVNARDAMPIGGKLTIETGNVQLDADYAREHPGTTAGPHVMLAVHDTGVGMDKATQARVFEPFFTTKEVGKGTGLGLSTVLGIAQQSGGSVRVSSELGKGTTFKVYFPTVDAVLDVAGPAPAPATLRGKETILLVEDQEQVRAVAHAILRRSGYRVLVAQNAADALLHCSAQAEPIELLVTDVVMPQMSGAELAKRAIATRPALKVLYMSGYTDDSVVRHGILESEMTFLQKPFTPETLTRKVREVLNASVAVVGKAS
ncbi:MAG TPA: PAS domain S-box protein [Polyangiaceae bacterium]|nr:PAS domain S-box protein [Polyangiaceae bacterium]